LRKNKKNNIYFQKVNLKKKAEKRGSKVFPKIKNGQKKCPIFKNAQILRNMLLKTQLLALCSYKVFKTYKFCYDKFFIFIAKKI